MLHALVQYGAHMAIRERIENCLPFSAKAIRDDVYFRKTLEKVIETREWTKQKLAELGFVCTDSQSNFLFVSHKRIPARELFAALKKAGIYVRYFPRPRIDNYLRISIGTQAQMEALTACLQEYLNQY